MKCMRAVNLIISFSLFVSVEAFAGYGNFGTIVKAAQDAQNAADVSENPNMKQNAVWANDCDSKDLFNQAKQLSFEHKQFALTDQEKQKFSGVGAFFCKHPNGSWRHFGTGFLTSASRNHIVTNSHVFIPKNDRTQDACGGERDLSKIKFFSEACGEFYDVVRAEKKTEDPSGNPNDDIAAVKLAKPICSTTVGLKMKVIDKNQTIRLRNNIGTGVASTYPYAGYMEPQQLARMKNSKFESTDVQNGVASIQTTDRVAGYGKINEIKKVNDGYMIEYTVNTERGASGGPLVDKQHPEEVFGLHVGFESDASKYNWGIAFSDSLIKWFNEKSRQ